MIPNYEELEKAVKDANSSIEELLGVYDLYLESTKQIKEDNEKVMKARIELARLEKICDSYVHGSSWHPNIESLIQKRIFDIVKEKHEK